MFRHIIATVIVLAVLAVPAAGQGLSGDANGDGFVDGADFDIWYLNRFQSGTDTSTGDFNGDGITDGQDFIEWNSNKFFPVESRVQNVPEPTALVWLLLSALLVHLRLRRIR